jgi:hypothetical protein
MGAVAAHLSLADRPTPPTSTQTALAAPARTAQSLSGGTAPHTAAPRGGAGSPVVRSPGLAPAAPPAAGAPVSRSAAPAAPARPSEAPASPGATPTSPPAAPAAPADALANPAANLAPNPNFDAVCQGALASGPDSDTCEQSALAALDAARAGEGLPPLALPVGFLAMPPSEQLFVLVNEERAARGLPPAIGVVPALSTLAADGAAVNADPPLAPLASGGPWAVSAQANWAADYSTAASIYDWMYADGWGGSAGTTTNETCSGPGAPGCWSHRDNILATAPSGYVPVLGVASQPEPQGSSFAGLESDAMVLTFVPANAAGTLPFAWTWSQEVAAGA